MCFDPVSLTTAAISAGTAIVGNMKKNEAAEEATTASYKADLASYESSVLAYEQELAEYDARKLLYEADLISQEAGFEAAISEFESYDARARALEQQAFFDVGAATREIQSGEFSVARAERDIVRLSGDQRARYLSSGVDIEGSPAMVIEASKREGALEIETIRFNAKAGAEQFTNRAALSRMEATESRRAGNATLDQAVTLAATPIPAPVTPPSFIPSLPATPPRSTSNLATTLSNVSAFLPVADRATTLVKNRYNRRTPTQGNANSLPGSI